MPALRRHDTGTDPEASARMAASVIDTSFRGARMSPADQSFRGPARSGTGAANLQRMDTSFRQQLHPLLSQTCVLARGHFDCVADIADAGSERLERLGVEARHAHRIVRFALEGTRLDSVHLFDWVVAMPSEWHHAFPFEDDPFTHQTVIDTNLRRVGRAYAVAFINAECCFLDGPTAPQDAPKCRACGAAKWQARWYGIMPSRCSDQLAAVARTHHQWSENAWAKAFDRPPDAELAAIRWQRSLLSMQPKDAVQGLLA
eukprot:gene34148-13947_t